MNADLKSREMAEYRLARIRAAAMATEQALGETSRLTADRCDDPQATFLMEPTFEPQLVTCEAAVNAVRMAISSGNFDAMIKTAAERGQLRGLFRVALQVGENLQRLASAHNTIWDKLCIAPSYVGDMLRRWRESMGAGCLPIFRLSAACWSNVRSLCVRMYQKRRRICMRLAGAVGGAALMLSLSGPVGAANGTWTQTTSGGLWSDSGNWSGGTIADGGTFTAFFNALDITADNIVHLDSARNIGALNFGDTATGTAAGWTLDNNGNVANVLTLTGGNVITVSALGTGKVATISAGIGGSGGLSKSGAGTLTLTGNNTIFGQLTNSNTGSTVNLGATGGSAAGGVTTIFLGGGNYNAGGSLQLLQDNQINDSAIITLQAGHYSGHGVFSLLGHSETIGGLVGQGSGNGGGASIVQNAAATNGTLTINVGAGQSYSSTRDNTNTGKNVIQNGGGGGVLNIVKTGAGTQTFGVGTFSYTGTTTIDQGTLVLSTLNNSFNSATTVESGAVLQIAGATNHDHPTGFSLALNDGATLNKTNTGYDTFNSSNVTLSGATTINITNNGTSNQLFIGGAGKGLTGSGTLTINNTGTATTGLTLRTGLNAAHFNGAINVNGGVINLNSGAGLALDNTDLTLTGAKLTLDGTNFATSGATNASVKSLTGNSASSVALGAQTLTLGTNNGTGGNFAGAIGGTGAVIKTGTGTQALSGANTYSGTTTISQGTLIAKSANALGNAVGNNVSVASGAALNYAADADAQLAIGGTLTVTAGAGSTIGGSIGSAPTSAEVNVTGAATISDGAHIVNIYGVAGTTPATGTYTLIHGGVGSSLNPATAPTLGAVYNNSNFTIGSFIRSATDLQVGVTAQTALTAAYWKGTPTTGLTKVWAASDGSGTSNWASAAGGAVQALIPSSGANVFISADTPLGTAPTGTTLGASMSVNSLTIQDTVNGLSLNADGNTLTLGAGGLTVDSGAGAVTLNSIIKLGGAQNWANNSSNTLTVGGKVENGGFLLTASGTGDATVSGAISGTGGLTKSGNGTLRLDGANTYTGATAVNGGTLEVRSTSALGSTSAVVTLANTAGANLDITGFDTTVGSVAGGGATGGNIVLGAATLTTGGLNTATTYSGAISGTGGSFVKNGTATMTFSGSTSNTYTGTTTVNQGALSLGKTGGAFAVSGNLVFNNNLSPDVYTTVNNQFAHGTVVSFANNAGDHGRLDLMGTTQTVAGIDSSTYAAQRGVVQNSEAIPNAGASSLVLNGSGTYLFGGFLRNGSGAGTGTLGLVKSGTGTQTLFNGAVGYTGGTTVNDGVLNFSLSGNTVIGGLMTLNGGTLIHSGTGFLVQTGVATVAQDVTMQISGTGTTSFNSQFYFDAGLGIASGKTLTLNTGLNNGIVVRGNSIVAGSIIVNGAGTTSNAGRANVQFGAGATNFSNTDVTLNNATMNVGKGTNNDANAALGATLKSLSGDGKVVSDNQSGTLTVGSNDGSGSFSGVLSDGSSALSLTKIGTGTQILSGGAGNAYSGNTFVNAGELHLGKTSGNAVNAGNPSAMYINGGAIVKLLNDNQLGDDGEVNIANGQLNMQGNSDTIKLLNSSPGTTITGTSGSALTVGTAVSGSGGGIVEGVITGGLAFTKTGTGLLDVHGANTYGGATAIQNGTVFLGIGDDRLPTTTTVTLGDGATSGKLRLSDRLSPSPPNPIPGRNQTLSGLLTSGTGTNNRVVGGGATGTSVLTLSIASGTNTYDGFLGGPSTNENNLALTKTGAGTLELTAANTYLGVTNVNQGKLVVNGTHLGAVGHYTVASGGALGGDGVIDATVDFLSGGIGAPGNSIDLLTTGDQTWNNNSIYEWEVAQPGAAGTDYDSFDVAGLLDFTNVTNTMTLKLYKLPGDNIDYSDTFALWTFESLAGWDAAPFAASGKFTLVNLGYFDLVNGPDGPAKIYWDGENTIWLTGISVPEPSTYALALLGLAGLGLFARRKTKSIKSAAARSQPV